MLTATPVNQGQFRSGSDEYTRFCYAHGLLEDELGYDLMYLKSDVRENEIPEKEGIYTCDVIGYDGGCWAFVWKPQGLNCNVCIIVDVADVEGMEYARDCFMNKKSV